MDHKWFHLVDLDGAALGSTTVVSVGTEDVPAFRDAVITECRNVLAHIDAFQLIVHESQAAFNSAHPPLDADANIGSLGNARKDALVVVAPIRRTLGGGADTNDTRVRSVEFVRLVDHKVHGVSVAHEGDEPPPRDLALSLEGLIERLVFLHLTGRERRDGDAFVLLETPGLEVATDQRGECGLARHGWASDQQWPQWQDLAFERAWQMELYKAIYRCTPRTVETSVDSGALFGSPAFLDLTVQSGDQLWGIEVVRRGVQGASTLAACAERVARDGAYSLLQLSDYCLLDFQRVESIDDVASRADAMAAVGLKRMAVCYDVRLSHVSVVYGRETWRPV